MIELSDTDQIRNLLGRYCECIDSGDFGGLGELFTHGALAADEGKPFATGAQEVATFYRSGTKLHEGTPGTKHLVLDTVFEAPTEPDRAVARSSYVVLQATDELSLRPIISGRYRDEFTRFDGAWHFAIRRFFVDQVGDLSHHLADPSITQR